MAENLSIVGWTSYDSKYPTKPINDSNSSLIQDLVIEEIKKNHLLFAGDTHQNENVLGVPVFSDGTCLRCSMRAWGVVMALAHDESDSNYMQYYMAMNLIDDVVLPKNEAKIEASLDDDAYPLIINADFDLIKNAVSSGMPLMTTCKALNVMYEVYKEMMEKKKENQIKPEDVDLQKESGTVSFTSQSTGEVLTLNLYYSLTVDNIRYSILINDQKQAYITKQSIDEKGEISYSFVDQETGERVINVFRNISD